MSAPPAPRPSTPGAAADPAASASPVSATPAVPWTDAARAAAFGAWLAATAPAHGLEPATLRIASADASFRRYLRIDATGGATRIVMDAPPDREPSDAFVAIARLFGEAGLRVPEVLAWDREHGFLLLTDLGRQTMMDVLDPARPAANATRFAQATDALLALQAASRPGVLPAYDAALLQRELALFPDWYLAQHRGVALTDDQRNMLARTFDTIVARNLAAPSVFVHRDFMPRNLMVAEGGPALAEMGAEPPPGRPKAASAPSGGSEPHAVGSVGATSLGVLDFQDAVYGPITYDIASLMRDAFVSWDEDFVLDVTVRYWQRARQQGLPVDADFGEFWRGVEWMGLQRHLKVAGIFARLTLRDGKPKYLADTPRFLGYIRATCGRYRELGPLLRFIDQVEGTQAAAGWAFGRV